MTNLYDGQLTDLLQNESNYNPEIQALAYAVRLEKRRIMDEAQKTRTLAMISELPEAILDVLAVELRTPYYTDDLTIEEKREIIKSTLVWFFRAGTPSAVQELVAAVFGTGEVVEWFDFTEEPYTPGTFDIITDTRMTEDIAAQFLQIISRVKNTRSHIRRILVERHDKKTVYIGSGAISAPRTNVLNATQKERSGQTGKVSIGAGAYTAPKEYIVNNVPARGRSISGTTHIAAAAFVENEHLYILNCPPPSAVSVEGKQVTAIGAVASSKISIE